MKTPRELLLDRHEAATNRLNIIRRQVIADEFGRQSSAPETGGQNIGLLAMLWRAMFAPGPKAWAGLAAVWAVVFVLHFASHAPRTELVHGTDTPPSPQVLTVLKEQRQMLAELAGTTAFAGPTQPRKFEPKPRSEAYRNTLNA